MTLERKLLLLLLRDELHKHQRGKTVVNERIAIVDIGIPKLSSECNNKEKLLFYSYYYGGGRTTASRSSVAQQKQAPGVDPSAVNQFSS
jgi:hypothetical protein